MIMKTLLAAAVLSLPLLLAAPARAAMPCQLTDDDYQALQQSGGHYSREAIPNLSADQQRNLCLSRSFVKRVKAGESANNFTLKDIPRGMSRFVTDEEYDSVRDVLSDVMSGAAGSKMA